MMFPREREAAGFVERDGHNPRFQPSYNGSRSGSMTLFLLRGLGFCCNPESVKGKTMARCKMGEIGTPKTLSKFVTAG